MNHLDPADPAAFAAWLKALRTAVDDLAGAAEDMLRPRRGRRLGHVRHDQIATEATHQLEGLLVYAGSQSETSKDEEKPPST